MNPLLDKILSHPWKTPLKVQDGTITVNVKDDTHGANQLTFWKDTYPNDWITCWQSADWNGNYVFREPIKEYPGWSVKAENTWLTYTRRVGAIKLNVLESRGMLVSSFATIGPLGDWITLGSLQSDFRTLPEDTFTIEWFLSQVSRMADKGKDANER